MPSDKLTLLHVSDLKFHRNVCNLGNSVCCDDLNNPLLPSSSMMLLGRTQCPQYFLDAHTACLPFSPRLYASINWRDRFENFCIIANGMDSSAMMVFSSKRSSQDVLRFLFLHTLFFFELYFELYLIGTTIS